MGRQYTAKQFIEAIPGSAGIISTIAKRVGCDWSTARRYIEEFATVKEAYEIEQQRPLEMARSVVYQNIQTALKVSQTGVMADSSDAKWLLSKRDPDFIDKSRQEITGKEGGDVTIKVMYDNERTDGAAQEPAPETS